MYTRWKKIKEELNVKKEYIKEIRKSAWEAGLKMITLEDEEGTQVDILYYLPKKTYEISIDYSNGISLSTSVLHWDEEPIFYERKDDGSLKP